MKTFIVTIADNLFGEMQAEINANNSIEAAQIAKEHYAYELGTDENYIEIISVI
jgi:hypothetical protein